MKKLVVFDLDGTLYKAESSFIPAVKRLLGEYELYIPPDNFILSFIGEPNHIFHEWLNSLRFNDSDEVIKNKIDTYEIEAVQDFGLLFNSVIQVFDWLKLHDYEIGLCTNATKDYLEKVLDKFQLQKYFSVIKFPLNKEETKSNMLQLIREEFNPTFAFMVGDRKHDFEAAKNNNFISVAMTYGYGKNEIETVDYRINNLWELEEIL